MSVKDQIRSSLLFALGSVVSAFRGARQEIAPVPFLLHPEVPIEQRKAHLDAFIREQVSRTRVPGLSIALVHDSKLAWANGYGVANSLTGRVVTPETPFEAASIRKCLTAYAALKLVDEGRLDLEQPLSIYLGEQFVSDDQYRNKITAKTVLTHTSGLSNDLTELKHRVGFEPGSRFFYSGVGFMYLQNVIEEVTRRKFNDFMSETIFPLGMCTSSYFRVLSQPRMSRGHFHLAGLAVPMPFFPVAQPNAANLLRSTAADLARFASELMNPKLVSQKLVKAMLSQHVHLDGEVWWGLGIGLYNRSTTTCFWHWGDNLDFESYLIGCPDEKIGVVVMTNSSRGLKVAPEIAANALSGGAVALTVT
jgi:CubicO group peptidase (beta-lactamase class C family)